jgi:DNA modification methylase
MTSEPYYADELVTLYHGDCLAVLPSLPDESADIVVTSPPYNMGLVPGGNGRGMGDVWRLGIETKVRTHPAPFPVTVPARCIEATGAQSVLDPFAGSGSTLRAARDAGIRGTGIEVNAPYCDLAVSRLARLSPSDVGSAS